MWENVMIKYAPYDDCYYDYDYLLYYDYYDCSEFDAFQNFLCCVQKMFLEKSTAQPTA